MKFDVILADPPWPQNARNNPKTRFGLGAHGHYHQMRLEEIYALPVKEVAAERCMLFLWATWPKLKDAMAVVEAWGFRYSTLGFNWTKLNPKSGTPFFGVGHYGKSGSEVCLLAHRGRPLKPAVNTVSSTLLHARLRHSEKPEEVQRRIELMYPEANKLELFARRQRANWTTLGDGIDGQDILTALEAQIFAHSAENSSCQLRHSVVESIQQ